LKQRKQTSRQSCSFTLPQLFCSRVFPTAFQCSPLSSQALEPLQQSMLLYNLQPLALLREKPPPRGLFHLFRLSHFHLPPSSQGNTTQADKLMRQLALCSLIEGPFISLTSQANSQHHECLTLFLQCDSSSLLLIYKPTIKEYY